MKKVAVRFDLDYRLDDARVPKDARSDGIFPLASNVLDLSEQEALWRCNLRSRNGFPS